MFSDELFFLVTQGVGKIDWNAKRLKKHVQEKYVPVIEEIFAEGELCQA